ncbi:MAG: acetyltransferase [Candidatus Omnitrophica bacterium]|nr:acetyltransferase [Candidatus Omnitrophota bacterium]
MSALVDIVGVGAGGYAKILAELIEQAGRYHVVGLTETDRARIGTTVAGYPVLGDDDTLTTLYRKGVRTAFLGVGAVSSQGNRLRARLFRQLVELGFDVVTLIHPQAVISPSATIGAGSVVLAGAVINTGARVGENVVIYSGAVIEHDAVIGPHAHVSPGVSIAGGVTAEEGVFMGIGASIIQGVHVGAWATIGAGAVVLENIPGDCTAVGVPARCLAQEAGRKP